MSSSWKEATDKREVSDSVHTHILLSRPEKVCLGRLKRKDTLLLYADKESFLGNRGEGGTTARGDSNQLLSSIGGKGD